MTRRATPQPGVDRMVSTSWSGRRWSSPAARQRRALARGLEGRLPLQHHYVRGQNSSSSRCRAYFSLAPKHGIYREPAPFRDIHPGARQALDLDHLSCFLASRIIVSVYDSPRRRRDASRFGSASISQSRYSPRPLRSDGAPRSSARAITLARGRGGDAQKLPSTGKGGVPHGDRTRCVKRVRRSPLVYT
jgi:hypothetical protein